MSPRTEEQYEEIRETRKSAIKKVALELFATEGFYATSISMISKKAGISKGLMYNYYESKEDLLKEIFREGIQKITALIDPDNDGVLTRREFRYMIDETFRMISENRIFWSLYFSIIPQPGVLKIVKEDITNIYKEMYGILIGYFTNAGYPEPETEAMIFGSMLDGISINYLLNPDF
ncbi:MAG TPA: TetR/AcrR family transcriptional regulator, partial [Bacteroidales bacterium]|nr:TetR/AcrR family transcriptional regulator [Bacteroidales bacterium]